LVCAIPLKENVIISTDSAAAKGMDRKSIIIRIDQLAPNVMYANLRPQENVC